MSAAGATGRTAGGGDGRGGGGWAKAGRGLQMNEAFADPTVPYAVLLRGLRWQAGIVWVGAGLVAAAALVGCGRVVGAGVRAVSG